MNGRILFTKKLAIDWCVNELTETIMAKPKEVNMIGKYKIITLCGSTRFKDEFLAEQKRIVAKLEELLPLCERLK